MELKFLLLSLMVLPLIQAANIQLLDITPEEAQKLITQQSLDLKYAKKVGESPAAGKIFNGKVIDSDDFTEEVYDANQFHGQDGLGRFVFGHADNQQARLEAGNVNGEVRGQYRYIDPWGNDIEVQYWSDSLGFHQSDNRLKFDLQPVTETPEVREARMEHEKLWKEAARINGIDADSNGFYQSDMDDMDGQVSNKQEKFARHPILSYDKHINSDNADDYGNIHDDAVILDAIDNKDRRGRARFVRQYESIEDVTSEPRGFFYSYDYPVAQIKEIGNGKKVAQQSENIEIIARVDDDKKKLVIENEDTAEESGVSAKITAGLLPEDEVHDVQTNPKQKLDILRVEDVKETEMIAAPSQRVSTRIHAGLLPEDEVHDVQISPKQKVSRSANFNRGWIRYRDTV